MIFGFKERPRHFFSDPRPRRGRRPRPERPRDPANPACAGFKSHVTMRTEQDIVRLRHSRPPPHKTNARAGTAELESLGIGKAAQKVARWAESVTI